MLASHSLTLPPRPVGIVRPATPPSPAAGERGGCDAVTSLDALEPARRLPRAAARGGGESSGQNCPRRHRASPVSVEGGRHELAQIGSNLDREGPAPAFSGSNWLELAGFGAAEKPLSAVKSNLVNALRRERPGSDHPRPSLLSLRRTKMSAPMPDSRLRLALDIGARGRILPGTRSVERPEMSALAPPAPTERADGQNCPRHDSRTPAPVRPQKDPPPC